MRKRIGLMFAAFAFAFTADAFTVKNLSASSRWPWNGILDVDFIIDEAKVSDLFRVEVAVKYANGTKKLTGRTYVSEPICGRGKNRVSWDARADYPNLKLSDMQVAVTVHPINADACDVYMVIDLSSGPESTKYPVRYTFTPPTLVPTNDLVACAKDPNRTTKLWLKRINESTFDFGGTQNNTPSKDRTDFNVRLSPYYIGIFEVTQKQWALVMDSWPSNYSNTLYRAARPVAMVNYEDVIGHFKWPVEREIKAESFVGCLRSRTGLSTLNLPTEAQWVCASKEGQDNDKQIKTTTGRCKINSSYIDEETENFDASPMSGTAFVGTYQPNLWGIYDMFGNVMEMCLDAHMNAEDLNALYSQQYDDAELKLVVDPIGPSTLNAKERYHATRGGAYYSSEAYCSSHRRHYGCRNETGTRNKGIGFRIVVSPEWK